MRRCRFCRAACATCQRTLFHISCSMGNFANTIAYQVFGNRTQFYYVDILG